MSKRHTMVLNEEQFAKFVSKIVMESIDKMLKEETWQTALQRKNRDKAQNLFTQKYNFKDNRYRDEEPVDGIETVSDIDIRPNCAMAGRTTKYNPDPDYNILSTDKRFSKDGVDVSTYHGGVPNSDFEWDDELNDYYSGDWADRMNQKRKKLGNYKMKGLDKPLRKPRK